MAEDGVNGAVPGVVQEDEYKTETEKLVAAKLWALPEEEKKKLTGKARALANLRPTQKGEVRNPFGRAKRDLDLAKKARRHAEKAILVLAEVMSNKQAPPAARVSAASELLDRGYGKAPQTLDLKMDFGQQLEAFLRELGDVRKQRIPAEKLINGDVIDVETD